MFFTTKDSQKICYEIRGNGIPIIFIQGVGDSGATRENRLLDQYPNMQIIRLDNRGIGRSLPLVGNITIERYAQDILELMDHLKLMKAHLVGHSMGGVIAQKVALLQPERILSLSLVCTFAQGKEVIHLHPRLLWITLKARIGCPQKRKVSFLELLFSKKFLDTKSLDEKKELARFVESIMGRDLAEFPPVVNLQLRALVKSNFYDQLTNLQSIPTQVISATEDPIALPKFGIRLHQKIPGSTFILIDHASHAYPIEHALDFQTKIFTFVQSA